MYLVAFWELHVHIFAKLGEFRQKFKRATYVDSDFQRIYEVNSSHVIRTPFIMCSYLYQSKGPPITSLKKVLSDAAK